MLSMENFDEMDEPVITSPTGKRKRRGSARSMSKAASICWATMAGGLFKDEQLVSVLADANTQFAVDLYKLVADTDNNIFLSPMSISAVLALTRLGARGNTQSEIDKVFKWTTLADHLPRAFQDYLQVLNGATHSYILTTANRIFVHNNLKLLDEFTEKTVKHFNADAVHADFARNPDGEKKRINEWVESQTNKRIKNIIAGSIDPLTRLILINAIYFKGTWEQKFDPSKTVKGHFQVSPGHKIEVDMMKLSKKFPIGQNEDLKCQVLELAYVQRDLSMFILLPFEADGLVYLEEKLNSVNLEKALSGVSSGTVDITLPKFVMGSTFALEKILPTLGMVDAFDEAKADFSGIAGTKDLYISQVVHKTFLEVNEEGSEAAAATAVLLAKRSMPIVHQFVANHPFLIVIRDNRAHLILFLGKLSKP